MNKIKVIEYSIGNLHLAARLKWSNWGIGAVIGFHDDYDPGPTWLTVRIGPLFFDVAYGEKPSWGR